MGKKRIQRRARKNDGAWWKKKPIHRRGKVTINGGIYWEEVSIRTKSTETGTLQYTRAKWNPYSETRRKTGANGRTV